ncbi:MBL fold metallo-hydrolase [bacterium]|nr:MBL fold metallo-hydrolase [bacterium]NUN46074.1 MBL fold metallo-hydrolase [bacterium]
MLTEANNAVRVCVLGSGSKGNSTFLQYGATKVLIDAGLSGEETMDRLTAVATPINELQHIFITHEHDDHIKGLKKILKSFSGMVHCNAGTFRHLRHRIPEQTRVHVFSDTFEADGLQVQPFSISHDATEPVGYSFQCGNRQVTVATDMGYASELVKARIQDSDILILESNHDEGMLMKGRYPWPLKQRIASRVGHLSNRQAGELMRDTMFPRLQWLVLAHLSEHNNMPDLAMASMTEHLQTTAMKEQIQVHVAHQHTISAVMELNHSNVTETAHHV